MDENIQISDCKINELITFDEINNNNSNNKELSSSSNEFIISTKKYIIFKMMNLKH